MLVFGPYRSCISAARPNQQNVFFNFSSLTETLPRLGYLLPDLGQDIYRDDIEIIYSNYVFFNDNPFVQMMHVIMPLYEGANVFICTSGDTMNQYISTMNELLQNLIQNRYGYHSAIINDPEDLESFDESMFGFSVQGIKIFDQDKERWTLMIEEARLRAGGAPYR